MVQAKATLPENNSTIMTQAAGKLNVPLANGR